MVKAEHGEPKAEPKKTWETPRLRIEGNVSEITARISVTVGPGTSVGP